MSSSSQTVLTQQTWEWFIESLASPGFKGSHRLQVPIADIVLAANGTARAWYFSGKDNYVSCKSGEDLSLPDIAEEFEAHAREYRSNAARYAMAVRKLTASDGFSTRTTLLTEAQLGPMKTTHQATVPSELGNVLALQLYCHATGGAGTVHRSEYALSSNRRKFHLSTYKFYMRKMTEAASLSTSTGGPPPITYVKTFQKSSHTALNESLDAMTLRLVRFVEAVRRVVIHRVYCDYIVDEREQIRFIQAVNVFTTARVRAVPREPSVPLADRHGHMLTSADAMADDETDERRTVLRIARSRAPGGSDPSCAGDFCDYDLQSSSCPAIKVQLLPRDGSIPSTYFQLSNKSVILGRFESAFSQHPTVEVVDARASASPTAELEAMMATGDGYADALITELDPRMLMLLQDAAEKSVTGKPSSRAPETKPTAGANAAVNESALAAGASRERGGSPSTLSGPFELIKAEDYYKEVTLCARCYRVYMALDARRGAAIQARERKERKDQRANASELRRVVADHRAGASPSSPSPGPGERAAWGSTHSPTPSKRRAADETGSSRVRTKERARFSEKELIARLAATPSPTGRAAASASGARGAGSHARSTPTPDRKTAPAAAAAATPVASPYALPRRKVKRQPRRLAPLEGGDAGASPLPAAAPAGASVGVGASERLPRPGSAANAPVVVGRLSASSSGSDSR